MPTPVSDEMMKYMIEKGYIVVSLYQDPKLRGSEVLYEFGNIPPSSDVAARELFFELYREAQKYQLVEGKVYRHSQAKRPHRRRKRR